MKKIWTVLLAVMLLLTLTACGEESAQNQTLDTPDITIDQIDWTVTEGELEGDQYVLCEYLNNTPYTITSLKLTFQGKEDVTQEQMERFYADFQQVQGFGDAFMEENIKNLPMVMFAQADVEVAPGGSVDAVKCLYFGGFTSKNLLYANMFTPEKAVITYEKNGKAQTVEYEFASGEYAFAEVN